MEDLWEEKGKPYEGNLDDLDGSFGSNFNCVPLELEQNDLERLFENITNKTMPETSGFFFGDDSFSWTDDDDEAYREDDYYYKVQDLTFVRDACKAIKQGKKVYYNSWW